MAKGLRFRIQRIGVCLSGPSVPISFIYNLSFIEYNVWREKNGAWYFYTFHHSAREPTLDSAIDPKILEQQRRVLQQPASASLPKLLPLTNVAIQGNEKDKLLGEQLLSEGAAGCLIVAGGQGTRLRFEGPKGLYPISPVYNKTLFQLFAEKTLAASKRAGKSLPLAIMTSPLNHQDTIQYFKDNHYFGLEQDQLFFFSQGTLPLLDVEGNLLFESDGKIAYGPDGNGHALVHFVNNGIWDKWSARGVRFVNFVPVDNPLGDPFDVELLGFHARQRAEVTIKCSERRWANEKVGVIAQIDDRIQVIEYTEIPEEEASAVLDDGTLKFPYANLSLFCFSMDFIKKTTTFTMPLHAAFKAGPVRQADGSFMLSKEPNAWKFEWFIFDVLPFSDKVRVLNYPRGRSFAPVKNATGNDSPETVKRDLSAYDRAILSSITGREVNLDPFELAADFHYPTAELKAKWKGKSPNSSYVEP